MVQNVICNSGDGVRLAGGSGAVIDTNNLIGLNQLGNAALANTGNGISIVSSTATPSAPAT